MIIKLTELFSDGTTRPLYIANPTNIRWWPRLSASALLHAKSIIVIDNHRYFIAESCDDIATLFNEAYAAYRDHDR